jgi:hypothetical protein
MISLYMYSLLSSSFRSLSSSHTTHTIAAQTGTVTAFALSTIIKWVFQTAYFIWIQVPRVNVPRGYGRESSTRSQGYGRHVGCNMTGPASAHIYERTGLFRPASG